MEIVSMGLFTKVLLGQDFTIVDFSYKKFNIDSVGQSSIFNFLLETVFPGDHSKKNLNALDMHIEMNPRMQKSQMLVDLKTHAYWYVVVNMPLLNEIQAFFGGDSKDDKVDLTYYKQQAKQKAMEYMN